MDLSTRGVEKQWPQLRASSIKSAISIQLPDLLEGLPCDEIWAVDFEFHVENGERPTPVCMVARELRSGRLVRLWQDELRTLSKPPYSTGPDTLFVAYYASAELSCHLALDWPMPERILDLYAEFRIKTNGLPTIGGSGLVGALRAHGLASIGADEKHSMQELVMGGGPWSIEEQSAILDYCQTDVDALARLLPAMLPELLGRQSGPTAALGHALLRGRSMAAVARMEYRGVPIDVAALARLRHNWTHIQDRLVELVDRDFGVFEGRTFKRALFSEYLAKTGIAWPQLDSGQLDLRDDTLRDMVKVHPVIAPLRELRQALGQLRLEKLAVGDDGRNRTLLSPFRAKTGRNQPSNSRLIFGPSTWLRSLIKPKQDYGLAYVDFCSQEIGIAAALSQDLALIEAYQSGDPYLAFAKQAGLVPTSATKSSHKAERDRCKAVVLGVNYGMGATSLAFRLGISTAEAQELLGIHRRTYPRFWAWSQSAVDHAMLFNRLHTVFGWQIQIGGDANPRSLMNFPMQANGAEMLRLACCLATEDGLAICCPIHDALLLEAPLDRLDDHVARLQSRMAEASKVVLDGFEIKTDAEIVRWPERYSDERGVVMWKKVMMLLNEVEKLAA